MELTAKEKFTEWLRKKIIEEGLIDFHVTRSDIFQEKEIDEEAFFTELLAAVSAPVIYLPDEEVLGERSLRNY